MSVLENVCKLINLICLPRVVEVLTYFIIVRKVHEKCHFKFRGHQINCEMRK